MKHILLIAAVFGSTLSFSQKKTSIVLENGYTISIGDTLKLGIGKMPDGSFMYVEDNNFMTRSVGGTAKQNSINNATHKNFTGQYVVVDKIFDNNVIQTKNKHPFVKGINLKLLIHLEPAIEVGEVKVSNK